MVAGGSHVPGRRTATFDKQDEMRLKCVTEPPLTNRGMNRREILCGRSHPAVSGRPYRIITARLGRTSAMAGNSATGDGIFNSELAAADLPVVPSEFSTGKFRRRQPTSRERGHRAPVADAWVAARVHPGPPGVAAEPLLEVVTGGEPPRDVVKIAAHFLPGGGVTQTSKRPACSLYILPVCPVISIRAVELMEFCGACGCDGSVPCAVFNFIPRSGPH